MRLFLPRLFATFLWLAVAAAWADETPDMDRLMTESGLTDALKGFQDTLGASLARQDPDNLSPRQAETLAEKAGIAFAPGFLAHAVRDDLAARLSPADVKAILAWLDTDLGRKVSRLESRDEITARLSAQPDPPAVSKRRARLLDRLLRAGNFADIMVDIQYRLVEAMLRGMAAEDPARAAGVEPMLAELRARRAQELAHIKASLAQDFRVLYEPLSDDELRRYVRFSESPLGVRYNRAVILAFNNGLVEAAAAFGQLVAPP